MSMNKSLADLVTTICFLYLNPNREILTSLRVNKMDLKYAG